MSNGYVLTTHWFDLNAITQPTGNLTPALPWMVIDELSVGEKITVGPKRQMILHGQFTNNGTFINNGKRVIL